MKKDAVIYMAKCNKETAGNFTYTKIILLCYDWEFDDKFLSMLESP